MCLALAVSAQAQPTGWPQPTGWQPIDLQALVDAASPGDTLQLHAGAYTGAVLDRPLTLRGQGPETVLDGGQSGSTLVLQAPSITVEHLRVTGSGSNVTRKESGVWVDRTAPDARLHLLTVDSRGFGIWVDRASGVTVEKCTINGRDDAAIISDLGNGIHLFNATDAVVRGNRISRGRDGIYISNSTRCLIANNRVRRSRFAIHYMYAHENSVVGNDTDSSSVGIALMYSKRIQVRENRIRNSHSHGMLLRNLYDSRIEANDVRTSHDGLFFSGCYQDTLKNNWVANNGIGIQVSDSGESQIVHNVFVDNDDQLVYEGYSRIVWEGGATGGNYWSDYVGWDRDGDGIGDKRHYPNDIASYLVGRFPAVRLVLHSPAMLLLQGLEVQFPVLRPPGIMEARPLMRPPIPAPDAS